ncbi:MAG: C39 family peptidase [Akkermansia sp.]|nr:C39 family peptidase [Akkermansia sp.]
MIKSIRLLVASVLCSMACLAGDVSQAIRSGEFWKDSLNAAKQKYFIGVRYAPVDASTWRLPQPCSLTFGSLRTGEVLVHWGEDSVASLRLMVYNKGDDGVASQSDYFNRLDKAVEALTELTGVEPRKLKADVKKTGIKTDSWEWIWDGGAARLDAGYSGKRAGKAPARRRKKVVEEVFEAEFIRVDIGPDAEAISVGGAKDKATRKDIKSSIKRDEEGNVWLDGMPMVDQGQKGYCVPATLARVFAFYGMDGVDQHALAALCDSSADGGTSNGDMEDAMTAICKKFPVKFTVLENYMSTITELVPLYNKVATRKGKPSLNMYSNPMASADPNLLREARAGKKSQVKKWLGAIKKNIDNGCPVVWSTTLGLYPENPAIPQAQGGHMRLIIGYNMKEQTIIYTDSWGAGHEKKTMKAANALSMTNGRYTIKLR